MAPSVPPAAPAPSYRLELKYWGETEVERLYYVPSADAVAMQEASPTETWLSASPALRRITEGVEPFQPPHVTSVRVGRKVVREAADSYLWLFEQPSAGDLPDRASGWITTDLGSKPRSPWTDGAIKLWFSPRTGLLEHGLEIVRLPEETAAAVRQSAPIERTHERRIWPALALAGLLMLGVPLVAIRH